MTYQHIGVVGGGAWGTALAIAAARAGRQVTLWEHDTANAEQLASKRESLFLPGVRIDDAIALTRDAAAVARAPALLLVVPAQAMRKVVTRLAPVVAAGTPLVVCAKGIEAGTHAFMSDIVAQCAPKAVPAILSGPSFAADVARRLPTAVTLAAPEEKTAAALALALGSATFRPYHSTDVRGAEIGGAAKNVLAIGAGIVAGRQLGASATAALITRGFAELTRFGRAFGARPETLTGLSGLGDLVLTCSTPQSRNFSFGHALGKGQTPDQVRAGAKLSEGAFTAPVIVEMARAKGVEMPISAAVAAILDGKLCVGDAIEGLLTRPFRAED
jgi:glycerol-3-phosphate dehydrogenase (NAD(P)+)